MAKTVANRLQGVIDSCVDVVQSAFILGRLITDNVLLAYELMHGFKQRRLGRKGYTTLKLDMSKAYDKVEWGFIQVVMHGLGFHAKWVDLIMNCISTTTYSVRINGISGKSFTPTRGLRQGDPFSPFLFLSCSEGLSSLIRLAMQEGRMKGVKASRQGLTISHLLFTYDSILFRLATVEGATILRDVLHEYEHCIGQCVNFSKSIVFLVPIQELKIWTVFSQLLAIRVSTNPEKYFGLSNMIGRSKKRAFQNIIDKMLARIDYWSSRTLSQDGKEIIGIIYPLFLI